MHFHAKAVLLKLLQDSIDFKIKFVDGQNTQTIGNLKDPKSEFEINVKNSKFYSDVLMLGNLGLGEAYMEEKFELSHGHIEDFIEALLKCHLDEKLGKDWKLLFKIAPFRIKGFFSSNKKNVSSHYDIDFDVFKTFLDASLTYSCGYAVQESDDIDRLQINKFNRISKKLELRDGETLLDIGCGFGGMLIYAAKNFKIKGLGITNSKNHCEVGNEMIVKQGLQHLIKIELIDFKEISGVFDKVVSVGMLEHVARSEYSQYFKMISKILNKSGRGLVHFVGANTYKNDHDYFIQKYVFPMSNQPKLSEVITELENNELFILDIENMIRHYGFTARQWLAKFRENEKELKSFNGKFKKMFEYYLACCIAASNASDSALYQILFMKDKSGHIALSRV